VLESKAHERRLCQAGDPRLVPRPRPPPCI
jgi:hypothetical protein